MTHTTPPIINLLATMVGGQANSFLQQTDDERRVYDLLAGGRMTSYEIFNCSDLTLGEIQIALVRLHDANLVVRTVGRGRRQVYWSRRS